VLLLHDAMLTQYMLLCVRLFVTIWSCTERLNVGSIMQTTPWDNPGSLVFWCQRSQRKLVCAVSNCAIFSDIEWPL